MVCFDLNRCLYINLYCFSPGLTTLSLLKERSHQAGRRWNISGSVVAAFEPFLLSISDDVMTLWDRRDGSNIQSVTVKGRVLGVVTVLGDVQIGQFELQQ